MTDYDWGRSAELRCARDYLGLSMSEMAEMVGRAHRSMPMTKRSYQRMESGAAAVPQSLWPVLSTLLDVFDRQVDETASRTSTVVMTSPADSGWDRAVRSRAWRRASFAVTSTEDIAAQEELERGVIQ